MKECDHQGSKLGSILRGFPSGLFRDAGFAFRSLPGFWNSKQNGGGIRDRKCAPGCEMPRSGLQD